jgi:phosphoribosylglycinamide formyltransferase-1
MTRSSVPVSSRSVEKGSVPLGGVPLVGVLISGRGSNLQALVSAIADGRLRARIAVVISNVAGAGGLVIAHGAGAETLVLPHGGYDSRERHERAIVDALRQRGVQLVCLAGYMRLLGRAFFEASPSAVLNIHPSLLPAFPGAAAQRQAIEHGVKVSGATVHLVTPEIDAGPIVSQRSVPVLDDDTPERLAERILTVEHEIYPEAVERILWEPWRVEGRRVRFGNPAEAVR